MAFKFFENQENLIILNYFFYNVYIFLKQPPHPVHSTKNLFYKAVVSLPRNSSERNLREFTSIFVPRNGIPSCFLFR
jgi:hypothetical protein